MPSYSERRQIALGAALWAACLSFGIPANAAALGGGSPAAQSADPTDLVSGAPLRDPNVAVHVVERKRFAERGKHEVALYPAAVQVNGKYTQHVGTAISYTYHLHENFAVQLMPQYNWSTTETSFSQELIDKVSQEPLAATSLQLLWGVQAGVEVTPIYGKFAFYDVTLVRFAMVLDGGAGVGSTRHQLKPGNAGGPATFGDTGLKFLGSVGAGFRIQLGERFALRLEVRDLVYTARVDRVNGCNTDDLTAMSAKIDQGQDVATAAVSGSCQLSKFSGVDAKTRYNRNNDVPLALSLVNVTSSDVLNNVGFYAGVAVVF